VEKSKMGQDQSHHEDRIARASPLFPLDREKFACGEMREFPGGNELNGCGTA
jgi:hypothetical protein